MSTWEIAKPQRLALDGEVGETISGAVFLLARPALDGEAGPLAEGGSET
jgi:hypothetical protein